VAAAAAEVAAAEEEIATAEADLAAAQAAFEAAPGALPPASVQEVLDREVMAKRMEIAMARGEEKRRLGSVMSAARAAVQATRNARRAAERRGTAVEQTIERHRQRLQTLREAYEDDTWDLLAISQVGSALGQDVSPRSILIEARRRAEAELAELEGGD
jgi:hypothetical protein